MSNDLGTNYSIGKWFRWLREDPPTFRLSWGTMIKLLLLMLSPFVIIYTVFGLWFFFSWNDGYDDQKHAMNSFITRLSEDGFHQWSEWAQEHIAQASVQEGDSVTSYYPGDPEFPDAFVEYNVLYYYVRSNHLGIKWFGGMGNLSVEFVADDHGLRAVHKGVEDRYEVLWERTGKTL